MATKAKKKPKFKVGTCRAGRDGDCIWRHCPQKKKYRSGCPRVDWKAEIE